MNGIDNDILQTILKTTPRKFKVYWEKTCQCDHTNHMKIFVPSTCNRDIFNKAIVQLRRTWTDFLAKWLAGYDWNTARIEGYVQVDFIGDEVIIYRYHAFSPRTTISLADPDAFYKIGQSILRWTKDK
jgi:hypothetical protein